MTGVGDFDIFVSKLDSDGDLVWAKSIGGTNIALGFGIAVDGSGNVHTVVSKLSHPATVGETTSS